MINCRLGPRYSNGTSYVAVTSIFSSTIYLYNWSGFLIAADKLSKLKMWFILQLTKNEENMQDKSE